MVIDYLVESQNIKLMQIRDTCLQVSLVKKVAARRRPLGLELYE